VLEQITQYLELFEQLVLKVEEQDGQQNQTRKEIRMSNMKAQNLLEVYNNNFDATKDTRATMVMALTNVSDSKAYVVLNGLIKAFQTLVEQGQIKFDRVHKDTKFMNSRLFSLE
jgi:hypothetical protein